MQVHIFTFNAFAENTYVIASGPQSTCTIIDPGCADSREFTTLTNYLKEAKLVPDKIVLTHAHIDHVSGLQACIHGFDIPYYMHDMEKPVLDACPAVASMYGLPFDPPVKTHKSLEIGTDIEMGGVSWQIRFTPGHSPGSLCFYQKEHNQLIGGDVLFRDSIGRTDLPGGDHATLLESIRRQLYVLPDETVVYPGHGPSTTIGYEKKNNPFVQG